METVSLVVESNYVYLLGKLPVILHHMYLLPYVCL